MRYEAHLYVCLLANCILKEMLEILPEDDLHIEMHELVSMQQDMLNYINLGINCGKENLEVLLERMEEILEEVRQISGRED